MRVCIAGAGPAGLLLSVLLRRRGLTPLLLERTAPSTVGSERTIGVVLSRRGQTAALEGVAGSRLVGRVFHRGEAEQLVLFGGHLLGVERREVVAGLMSQSPPVTRGEILRADDGAHVVWRDEAGNEQSSDFDLVVGADGRDSAVRAQATEVVSRVAWIEHEWRTAQLPRMPPSLRGDCIHVWPLAGGFLHLMPVGSGGGCVGTLVLERSAMEHFEERLGPVQGALNVTELVASLRQCQRPGRFATVHCNQYHDLRRKAVLIGDAAHGTLVFAGQGMNAALEDAVLLDGLLFEAGATVESAIAKFSHQRVAEMEAMHTLGALAYSSLTAPPAAWRTAYQRAMSRVLPSRYPPSLYSLVNFDSRRTFQETLALLQRQNKWHKLGRIV
jgi:kynurenine 3-monooxygenase